MQKPVILKKTMQLPFILAFLFSASVFLSACSSQPVVYHQDNLRVEGNRLILDGIISEATPPRFQQLVDENPNLQAFVVNSESGDPLAAIQLGYLLHRSELPLIVDGQCLGQCANYLFTAATHRTVTATSVVAWRGGAMSHSRVLPWRNYMLPGTRDFLTRYSDAYLRRETRFFERINVNQDITVLGFDERLDCDVETMEGFYYSPAGLLALGLGATTFEQESEPFAHYPDNYCKVNLSNYFNFARP